MTDNEWSAIRAADGAARSWQVLTREAFAVETILNIPFGQPESGPPFPPIWLNPGDTIELAVRRASSDAALKPEANPPADWWSVKET